MWSTARSSSSLRVAASKYSSGNESVTHHDECTSSGCKSRNRPTHETKESASAARRAQPHTPAPRHIPRNESDASAANCDTSHFASSAGDALNGNARSAQSQTSSDESDEHVPDDGTWSTACTLRGSFLFTWPHCEPSAASAFISSKKLSRLKSSRASPSCSTAAVRMTRFASTILAVRRLFWHASSARIRALRTSGPYIEYEPRARSRARSSMLITASEAETRLPLLLSGAIRSHASSRASRVRRASNSEPSAPRLPSTLAASTAHSPSARRAMPHTRSTSVARSALPALDTTSSSESTIRGPACSQPSMWTASARSATSWTRASRVARPARCSASWTNQYAAALASELAAAHAAPLPADDDRRRRIDGLCWPASSLLRQPRTTSCRAATRSSAFASSASTAYPYTLSIRHSLAGKRTRPSRETALIWTDSCMSERARPAV